MRVVIADDNIKQADGIKSTVQKHFSELDVEHVFYNGHTLIEYLETQIPDILITDIMMPGYSGLDAARFIRERSSTAQIIIITAHEKFSYAKQAVSYQVCELISKPYDNRLLIDAIEKAIVTPVIPYITYFCEALNKISVRNFLAIYEQQLQNFSKRQIKFLIEGTMKQLQIDCEFSELLSLETSECLQRFSDMYYTRHTHASIVKQVKLFVRENYHDMNLSRTMIADHFNINVAHLSTVFNKESGISITDYITKIRMEHAKSLLTTTTLSIKEIATRTGFTTDKYFSQKFNEVVGMKPTQYQKVKANEKVE